MPARVMERGNSALLDDALFSNLAEQLPRSTSRQIVHAMQRCHDLAPLAFCLLTREDVMRDVRAQWQATPNALGDADVLDRNFDRAAQRVLRPRFSQRACDAPCELPCAWVVAPHPEHDARPCYPWQLAPEHLPVPDGEPEPFMRRRRKKVSEVLTFSEMRRRKSDACTFAWACRCEACCHVWREAGRPTQFGTNGIVPPNMWGPPPPQPWSSFFSGKCSLHTIGVERLQGPRLPPWCASCGGIRNLRRDPSDCQWYCQPCWDEWDEWDEWEVEWENNTVPCV